MKWIGLFWRSGSKNADMWICGCLRRGYVPVSQMPAGGLWCAAGSALEEENRVCLCGAGVLVMPFAVRMS